MGCPFVQRKARLILELRQLSIGHAMDKQTLNS